MKGALFVYYHAVGSVRLNSLYQMSAMNTVDNWNRKTFCMKFKHTKHRWTTARFASIGACNSGFKAVLCLRRLVVARTGSQTHPCGICGQQSGTGTSVPLSTSVFSRHYHSTNTPYSSFSTCCAYHNDKIPKPGNLLKTRGHSIEKYF